VKVIIDLTVIFVADTEVYLFEAVQDIHLGQSDACKTVYRNGIAQAQDVLASRTCAACLWLHRILRRAA